MQCKRGSLESPLAYHSALMALAMAAYPDVKQEALDLLVMDRMLALARDMGVVLLACSHEMQSSRWAAKCLHAHENLQSWSQMAAWTGDPSHDGEPQGWSPAKVVGIPPGDESPDGDLAAAAYRWDRKRGDAARRRGSVGPRPRDDRGSQRPAAICYRYGRLGLFARECQSRPRSQSSAATPAAPLMAHPPNPQASRYTSDTRPILQPHASQVTVPVRSQLDSVVNSGHSGSVTRNWRNSLTQWKKLGVGWSRRRLRDPRRYPVRYRE